MAKRFEPTEEEAQGYTDRYLVNGDTLEAIATDAGVSINTLRRFLAKRGVEIRPRGRTKGSKLNGGVVETPAPQPAEVFEVEPSNLFSHVAGS